RSEADRYLRPVIPLALAQPQPRVQRSLSIDLARCPFMVKVGDRIRLSSGKGPDRVGVVTAVTGSMVRVRWPSEEETTVVPAPGTLTVLAASGDQASGAMRHGRAAPGRAPGRKAVAKRSAAKKAATAKK